MPAAFAVSGRAGAVASWLNLVEGLVVGADEEISGGVAPIAASSSWRGRAAAGSGGAGPVLGCANRDPPKRRWPPTRSPIIGHWATPGCI